MEEITFLVHCEDYWSDPVRNVHHCFEVLPHQDVSLEEVFTNHGFVCMCLICWEKLKHFSPLEVSHEPSVPQVYSEIVLTTPPPSNHMTEALK